MNLLYRGKYKNRFDDIISMLDDNDAKVLELCFGDIYIADHCIATGRQWVGLDINDSFVSNAVRMGYDAMRADIVTCDSFPQSDVCIIAGSLYHFNDTIYELFAKMLDSAKYKILISEPVSNLSCRPGIIGSIAKRSANAGRKSEKFRFDENALIETMERMKAEFGFRYKIISKKRDMLIEIKHDRN